MVPHSRLNYEHTDSANYSPIYNDNEISIDAIVSELKGLGQIMHPEPVNTE
jgi:hypothetical protein